MKLMEIVTLLLCRLHADGDHDLTAAASTRDIAAGVMLRRCDIPDAVTLSQGEGHRGTPDAQSQTLSYIIVYFKVSNLLCG